MSSLTLSVLGVFFSSYIHNYSHAYAGGEHAAFKEGEEEEDQPVRLPRHTVHLAFVYRCHLCHTSITSAPLPTLPTSVCCICLALPAAIL